MKMRILCILLISFALKSYSQEQLTQSEKLYGLSLFWQEVNYNFAYFDQVPQLDWDKEYMHAIENASATTTDYDYYRLVQRLAVKLQDGHTEVYLPDEITEKLIFPNIELFESDNEIFITNVSPLLKKDLPIGAQIMSVNEIPVLNYLEKEIYPYISSSTASARKLISLEKMFSGFEGTSFDIGIQTSKGKKKSVNLELKKEFSDSWLRSDYKSTDFLFKKLGDYSYINLPSFEKTDAFNFFKDQIHKINGTEGVIIDLRQNIGGQSKVALSIAQHLIQEDELVDMPWKSKQHIASLKAWGNSGLQKVGYESVAEYKKFGDLDAWVSIDSDTIELKADRLKVNVPIVILMGEKTASSAENFLIYAKQNEEIMTIGTPSFGSTGQPIYFSLPGNSIARICAKRNFDIDGSEFVGKGIQPHIYFPTSLKHELDKTDAQLARAIQYLNGE